MKKCLILVVLVFSNFYFAVGQTTSNNYEVEQREREQRIQRQIIAEKQQADFRRLEILKNAQNSNANRLPPPVGIDGLREVYRNPTSEELATLSPANADLNKFAEFLRQPKTGLIKLVNGKGCVDERLVDASADCTKYSMPGAGASYSFKIPNYRIGSLADLTFEDGDFKCSGKDVQGILTNIGDIPLETVNFQTLGLKFLTNFKPETEPEKIAEIKSHFSDGILENGFKYRSQLKVIENTTYALRSIAYKGSPPAFSTSGFNKAKDVIIVFRVVRKGDDNTVTILWKELSRKDSPKLN